MKKINLAKYKEVSRPQSQYYYFLQLLKEENFNEIMKLINKHPGMLNNVYIHNVKNDGGLWRALKWSRTTVIGDVLNLIQNKLENSDVSSSQERSKSENDINNILRYFEEIINKASEKQVRLNIFIDEVEGQISEEHRSISHSSGEYYYVKKTKSLLGKYIEIYNDIFNKFGERTIKKETLEKLISLSIKEKEPIYKEKRVEVKRHDDEEEKEEPKKEGVFKDNMNFYMLESLLKSGIKPIEGENIIASQVDDYMKFADENVLLKRMDMIKQYISGVNIDRQTIERIISHGYTKVIEKHFNIENLNEATNIMNRDYFTKDMKSEDIIKIFKSIAEGYKVIANKKSIEGQGKDEK